MSHQITTAFVEQYKGTVELLVQQRGSVLRQGVTEETITGNKAFFEQIGSVVAQKKLSRHADTPFTPLPHARRSIVLSTYSNADLIDDADQIRMLIDPESSYAQAMANAMGRAMDAEIITAATGTAKTGVTGSTSTTLPSAQKVAVDFVETGSSTNSGLTVGKLREARKILKEGNVLMDEDLFIAVRPQQTTDLLRDDEVTSSDYATVKALVNGDINRYMGFTFLETTLLTNDNSSDITTCFAWARTGLKLGIGREPVGRVSERDDKHYSVQVYYAMDIGATRMEEEKVVEIKCDESP